MIYNSLLSEFGVLGFEYGYSLATPNTLVLWEAQFGDFYNGAQTTVDQYIMAAETKWRRMSGLVMLLPHGYEGQGPEHSSGRLSRFLANCADYNVTVANLTTPANLFHVLRRQLARPFRKPLIIFSPKSLLRHPQCVSAQDAFVSGTSFYEYYDDPILGEQSVKKLRKVLFCTGKIFYDLDEYRSQKNIRDVVIVRLEQLYPFPANQLKTILDKYRNIPATWVQEEPSNMGSWNHVRALMQIDGLQLIARKASSSPATGYKALHDKQQEEIIRKAFE
jgi:2-oxoglutarate dehydrogenase E1 component